MNSNLKGLLAIALLSACAFAVGAVSSQAVGPPDPGAYGASASPPDVSPFTVIADTGTGAASALKAYEAKRQAGPAPAPAPRTLHQFMAAYPDLQPADRMTQTQRDQLQSILRWRSDPCRT